MSHSSEISVESLENVNEQCHVEDTKVENSKSTNFKWPEEATKIVKDNIHFKPNQILRKLREANVFSGKMPSKVQLNNKVSAKKNAYASTSVKNTHELSMKVADYLKEPEKEIEAFVPFSDIDDTDISKEPRFTVVFSTKKNLEKLKVNTVLQTDATYRLNWMRFPVFIIGISKFVSTFPAIIFQELPLQQGDYLLPMLFWLLMRIVRPGHEFSSLSRIWVLLLDQSCVWRLAHYTVDVHVNILPRIKSVATQYKSQMQF